MALFFSFVQYFLVNIPVILFKEVWIGVGWVEECTLFVNYFVFVGETSNQSACTLSKAGLIRSSVKVRFNRLAKTAPRDVYLEHIWMLLFFKRSVNFLLSYSDPSLLSLTIGLFLEELRLYSEEFFIVWACSFLMQLSNQFLKRCLPLPKKIYMLYFFQEHRLFYRIIQTSMYHQYNNHWICWWYNFFRFSGICFIHKSINCLMKHLLKLKVSNGCFASIIQEEKLYPHAVTLIYQYNTFHHQKYWRQAILFCFTSEISCSSLLKK